MLDLGLRNGEVVRNALQEHQLRLRPTPIPRATAATARRPLPLSDRVIVLLKAVQQEQSEKRGSLLSPLANVL